MNEIPQGSTNILYQDLSSLGDDLCNESNASIKGQAAKMKSKLLNLFSYIPKETRPLPPKPLQRKVNVTTVGLLQNAYEPYSTYASEGKSSLADPPQNPKICNLSKLTRGATLDSQSFNEIKAQQNRQANSHLNKNLTKLKSMEQLKNLQQQNYINYQVYTMMQNHLMSGASEQENIRTQQNRNNILQNARLAELRLKLSSRLLKEGEGEGEIQGEIQGGIQGGIQGEIEGEIEGEILIPVSPPMIDLDKISPPHSRREGNSKCKQPKCKQPKYKKLEERSSVRSSVGSGMSEEGYPYPQYQIKGFKKGDGVGNQTANNPLVDPPLPRIDVSMSPKDMRKSYIYNQNIYSTGRADTSPRTTQINMSELTLLPNAPLKSPSLTMTSLSEMVGNVEKVRPPVPVTGALHLTINSDHSNYLRFKNRANQYVQQNMVKMRAVDIIRKQKAYRKELEELGQFEEIMEVQQKGGNLGKRSREKLQYRDNELSEDNSLMPTNIINMGKFEGSKLKKVRCTNSPPQMRTNYDPEATNYKPKHFRCTIIYYIYI